MARNDKHLMTKNHEKRQSCRLDEYRPISVKDLKAGIFHKATMLNYSKNGLYFETDSFLQPGTEIHIRFDNSSYVSFTDEFECKLAEIIWRKKLKESFYNFGYGVKLAADKVKEQKRENQREKIGSRRHPRKPYSKSVLYAANNQILEGTSVNLSKSGIFIKSNDKLSVGQTVILSLPSKNKKKIKIRGEVVWSNHKGFGVKFLEKIGN